jgi:hypothetical protein
MSAKRARNGFKDVDSCWIQLLETSKTIELSGAIRKGYKARFNKVTNDGEKKGLPRAAVKHHKFFDKVCDLDPDFRTLCSMAFSQNQIDSTKESILKRLYEKIKGDKMILSPNVRSLFTCLRNSHAEQPVQDSHQRSTSASGIWCEFKHAEREGTTRVFRDYLADKIKSTELLDKRGVTMRLPMWPLSVDGSMSIELREDCVKELRIALFKVEVDWVTDAFHVLHGGGVLQTIYDSKHTLSRVLEEDIVAVFGSDVLTAISRSHLRANEVKEERARTECVKMTFSKGMGTIELIMGAIEGINIQVKLGATAA